MIKIDENYINNSLIINQYNENSIERKILDKMSNSSEIYKYNSLDNLKFELQLRQEIVNSAIELHGSSMGFEVFADSRCNEKFWDRTNNGGFKLKKSIKSSDAINDIFMNGNKYGTECATAIMIIYYKALLKVFNEELFNKTFTQIYLMDWDVRDSLLREVRTMESVADIFLGDRQYFLNPDVNKETPEWQGENVIVLESEKYYGHGIGIKTSEQIIKELNSNRKEDATQSAYLNKLAGRPDFQKLYNVYNNKEIPIRTLVWREFPEISSTKK